MIKVIYFSDEKGYPNPIGYYRNVKKCTIKKEDDVECVKIKGNKYLLDSVEKGYYTLKFNVKEREYETLYNYKRRDNNMSERVNVTLRLDKEDHRKLKTVLAFEGKTFQSWGEERVEEYIENMTDKLSVEEKEE